jgi:hypothetical protein
MAILLNFCFTKPSASKPSNEIVDTNHDENNNDSGPVQAGSKTMATKRCFTARWLKEYSGFSFGIGHWPWANNLHI